MRENQHPIRIKLSGYGWAFVFFVFWIPIAAIGTANNFLIIIFLFMVGLAAVSHILAKRNIRSVSVMRRFPDEILAEASFAISYKFSSALKPWGAMFLLYDEAEPLGRGTRVGITRLVPGMSSEKNGTYVIASRGDKTVQCGKLRSSYPFGLATYSRNCGTPVSVLVFPKIEDVGSDIPSWIGGSGSGFEKTGPYGDVPYSLRQYVAGDPYKHIEWKKSAQKGHLLTKVLSHEQAREIRLRMPQNASEKVISRAASLIVHLSARGIPVGLESVGLDMECACDRQSVLGMLTVLARWNGNQAQPNTEHPAGGIEVSLDEDGRFSWMSTRA